MDEDHQVLVRIEIGLGGHELDPFPLHFFDRGMDIIHFQGDMLNPFSFFFD